MRANATRGVAQLADIVVPRDAPDGNEYLDAPEPRATVAIELIEFVLLA